MKPKIAVRLVQQSMALSLLFNAPSLLAADALIDVNTRQPGPKVNPRMYGIFLEEINHGVDGGLYAELIRNRGFEDSRPPEGYVFRDGHWRDHHGFKAGFTRFGYTTNGVPFWTLIQKGAAKGSLHLETSGGITPQSAYCVRLEAENADGHLAIANEGFFGIGVNEGSEYALSLYVRTDGSFKGKLGARMEDAAGNPCSDEVELQPAGGAWKKLTATLKATKTEPKARFVLTMKAPGKVWFDFISLFPTQTWKHRPNGLRPDLAQMIADLKPGFVRFPGGCVVEAGTVETAYDWRLTLGPLEQREERWGPWNYRRTQGMGIYEYFQFCEDLGAEPLWVGFAGQTCIFREREHVPMSEMGPVRDSFLELIDYANGDANTKWGKHRAEAGHALPFNLKLVEIGNENQGREFGERYRFIHAALKERYPDLKYFADLSWTSRESLGGAQFDFEDQHYYNSPAWFASRFKEYDKRDRSLPPLYLGEVAVTSNDAGPDRGNLRAALAEGIFLMGCERNADVVQMVSYAPLLGHVEGRTELTDAPPPWHAMIYFDGTRAFGTASYYLWKTFAENVPTFALPTEVTIPAHADFKIAGQIGIGTWNTSAEFRDVRVEREGQVLYESDFSTSTEGWTSDQRRGGEWRVENGAFRQPQPGRSSRYFGSNDWDNYTLTLKARKLAGGEGFLIMFGRQRGETYWWNLGGWGNSQHAVERSAGGAQTPVGAAVRGQIETGRWYDVKVEVRGRQVRCHLDGALIHDVSAEPVSPVFAVAGRDEAKRELVLKLINYGDQPFNSRVNLAGGRFESEADAITLASGAITDNNSLDQPQFVTPKRGKAAVSSTFNYQLPAHSLTILRLKQQ